MSESEEILSKRSLIIIGIISLFLLVVGIILVVLDYNEALYIENSIVQIIFEIITFTGTGLPLIILIAIFSFTYDKRFAKNFFFLMFFTGLTNMTLKDIFKEPRPLTNITKEAERGYSAPGYGFPSGHAQMAASIWGYTAYRFKDKARANLIPIILSVFIFLVALSRAIIGVHSLKQIVWGLLIGIMVLIAFLYLEPIISEKINYLSLSMKLILAIIVPILIAIIGPLAFPEFAGVGRNFYAALGGVLFGLFVGYVLEGEYVKYEPSELEPKQKTINLIVGLIIVLLYLFLIMSLIQEQGTDILLFISSAIFLLIITLVCPFIFTKINRT